MKTMQVYETLWDYVDENTPTVDLPVFDMRLAITPVSENSQFMDIGAIETNIFDDEIDQGTFDYYTGGNAPSDTRIRSKNGMLLDAGIYEINADGVYACVIYIYDEDENYLQDESTTSWTNLPATFTLSEKRKVKFAFRNYNSTPITPSDISDITLYAHGSIENYNLYYTGLDLSVIFNNWEEVPHISTQVGSLIQCDSVVSQIGGEGDYEFRDTSFGEIQTTQPGDWETNWFNYCLKVTPNGTSGNEGINIHFPVSRTSYHPLWQDWGQNGVPYFDEPVYLNNPTNPAKKISRIFTSKSGGSFGISATGNTENWVYIDGYQRINRVGGFSPGSSVTNPPNGNYPYNATYQNNSFGGCFPSSVSAGQMLGYLSVFDLKVYHNQIFILVHFVKDEKDFYGYALMDMTDETSGAVPRTIRITAFSEEFWGESITPEPPEPSDPSGPESTTGGGDGAWTYTSNDRGGSDGSAIDTILTDTSRIQHVNDIINGGGFNVYQIRPQAVSDVVGVLYGSGYFSRFENYMYNPLSAILSYHLLPAAFTSAVQSGGSDLKRNLTAGGYDITANMQTPEQFVILESLTHAHIGSVDLSAYFGAYPDYAPYTKITLHLPYIGDIEIDPNVCMRGTLAVDYLCDVVSGNVCAWVYVRDKDGHSTYLYSGTGNCAYNVPLYTQSADGSAVGKIVGGAAGLIVLVTPASRLYDDSRIFTVGEIYDKRYIYKCGSQRSAYSALWTLYKRNRWFYATNEAGELVQAFIDAAARAQ